MVTLIGMGSGKWEALSAQAQQAVRSAGLVFGAKRLLAGLSADCTARQFALYQPADILETLAQNPGQDAAVLYSGDTGFYSGASGLLTPLRALGIPARVYPGVSSIQLLSAALGRPWQDWKLVSAHGCACDPVAECMMNRSVFFLTGGTETPASLCQKLTDAGMGEAHGVVGENLGTEAEAIRYGVEHFRRNRGRCMGTVIWQLNDCWPVASWSSIDYCGRWKALHYYAKRFFAPVMLSCAEEGILTQDTNPNAEPYEVKKSIHLCVANETMQEQQLRVEWSLRNNRSEILRSGSEEVTVSPLSSLWLEKTDCMDADTYGDYVSYTCFRGEERVSGGTVIFCAPKHYRFADPGLTVTVSGDELTVRAQAYARGVEIINEADDMLLEDNYFDMDAGERKVKILKGSPDGLKIRSVYNIR